MQDNAKQCAVKVQDMQDNVEQCVAIVQSMQCIPKFNAGADIRYYGLLVLRLFNRG
jgi:hypothetical protein